MQSPDTFNRLLSLLGVPHTAAYSRERFCSMSFKSWFGLKKLLEEYGVEAGGVRLADKTAIGLLPVPFLAATSSGTVIVGSISDGVAELATGGKSVSRVPLDEFSRRCTGDFLLFESSSAACEPGYRSHRMLELASAAKRVCLAAGVLFLFLYLVISNGIYTRLPLALLTLLDLGGLYVTFLLMQKSLRIHNPKADAVCRVIDEGGCDSVLSTKASTFFGIFSWSEVGFAYFSVSLLCLLVFPGAAGSLAFCNLCCLPFSLWSVWYQKFRVGKWCTLCLCVQATLWLEFFCYLGGGYLSDMFPLRMPTFVLGASYLVVLLLLNRLSPFLKSPE